MPFDDYDDINDYRYDDDHARRETLCISYAPHEDTGEWTGGDDSPMPAFLVPLIPAGAAFIELELVLTRSTYNYVAATRWEPADCETDDRIVSARLGDMELPVSDELINAFWEQVEKRLND